MRSLTNEELNSVSAAAKNPSSLSYTIIGGLIGMAIVAMVVDPRERIPASYLGFLAGAFIGGAGADIYYTIQSVTNSD